MQASAIHSLRRVAWTLGVPLGRLKALAAPDYTRYKTWENKAGRTLANPCAELKHVQRLIRERLLVPVPLPECMHGCVKGRSTLSNAAPHLGQRNLAKVDLKRFFPSVTNRMVFDTYLSIGFGPGPARLLTTLSTDGGHLPQGAPTSDRLAALVIAPCVAELEDDMARRGFSFTVFVDDFAVSGDDTRDAISVVIKKIAEAGFSVGRRKTFNAGASRAHVVTGYTANSKARPSVSRKDRRRLRATVNRLICARQCGAATEQLEGSVRGTLTYLRRTNRGEVRRLEQQLAHAGIRLNA